MKTPTLVYLAAPYAHPDPTVMDARYHAINGVVADLMLQGIHVYSPITHNHPLAVLGSLPRGWDFWKEFDLPMLRACHRLLILKLDGWETSVGVTAEANHASLLGMPIDYMDAPKNAPRVARDGVTMLTLSAYAIIHLHETGQISEGQAVKLMNTPDVVSYRIVREHLEKEMAALLEKDIQIYAAFTMEKAQASLADRDPIREKVSALPPEERDRLAKVALAAIKMPKP